MGSQRGIPSDVGTDYEWQERRSALAIMRGAHRAEWRDLLAVLRGFRLPRSEIAVGGGNISPIAKRLASDFRERGWEPRNIGWQLTVEGRTIEARTHEIDCFKSRIALEIEWNGKDTSFPRDLDAFRRLYEFDVIDLGVIVTRQESLYPIFEKILGRGNQPGRAGSKYGASTTHMSKLMPHLDAGVASGCPVIAVGIGPAVYDDDR